MYHNSMFISSEQTSLISITIDNPPIITHIHILCQEEMSQYLNVTVPYCSAKLQNSTQK